jgi:hypothetical protein
METVESLLSELGDGEHVRFARAIGVGLESARQAMQCVAGPRDQHTEHVVQLLAYLSEAIRELGAAREIIRRHG